MASDQNRIHYVHCREVHVPAELGWAEIAANVFDAAVQGLDANYSNWETARVRVSNRSGEWFFTCTKLEDGTDFDLQDWSQ